MADFFTQISQAVSQSPAIGDTRVLAIDGPAGAGKTTLAAHLVKVLSVSGSLSVIHMDWIYDGWEGALGTSLTEKLSAIIGSLQKGETIKLDIYNWHSGVFDQVREIAPAKVLIIEGVGAAQKLIRDSGATSIWLDIAPEAGMKRVLARDGDAIEAQMKGWLITQDKYFHRDLTPQSTDFSLSAT